METVETTAEVVETRKPTSEEIIRQFLQDELNRIKQANDELVDICNKYNVKLEVELTLDGTVIVPEIKVKGRR